MYFAQYDLSGQVIKVAAATLAPRSGAPLFDQRWAAAFIDTTACDYALRLRFRPDNVDATMLLNTYEPRVIESSIEGLLAADQRSHRIKFVSSSTEFDALVGDAPEHQAWLNHDGYSVNRHAVAADFEFLPLLERVLTVFDSPSYDFAYQVNLRRYEPSLEDRRAVRKLVAALEIESPFPADMTRLQCVIANRLLTPAFEADEFLASSDDSTFRLLMTNATRHFESTMGPFGFSTTPIETGRFDDLLQSGLHSSHFESRDNLLSRGSGIWSTANVKRLLSAALPAPPTPATKVESSAEKPPIFVSYSSSDFLQAMATARHLETSGIPCWIAPRNIPAGASYPDAIMDGISNCKVLVALLSDSSNVSPQVHREIERALNRGVVIIPLRIENVLPTQAMEFLLATCQWIDAYAPDFDRALEQLTRRIAQLLVVEA